MGPARMDEPNFELLPTRPMGDQLAADFDTGNAYSFLGHHAANWIHKDPSEVIYWWTIADYPVENS